MKSDSKMVNFTAKFDYSINLCGGVIYGQKITITSSNYPNNYQQNTNCAWALKLLDGEPVNVSILKLINYLYDTNSWYLYYYNFC